MMVILIDNGHGRETAGKRSPDGLFREYYWNRRIADKIVCKLRADGYDARHLVPEENDVPLTERVRRVQEVCTRHGAKNVVLVSIHVNAAGNGSEWLNATGWSAYTSKGMTKADDLATCLYEEAEKELKGRRVRYDYSDGDPDWEENFYILRRTPCPAVLTENFFMDNRNDLAYITSPEGKRAIINLHVNGIRTYVDRERKSNEGK